MSSMYVHNETRQEEDQRSAGVLLSRPPRPFFPVVCWSTAASTSAVVEELAVLAVVDTSAFVRLLRLKREL